MSQNGKGNETLKLHANPIKAPKVNSIANHAPTHEEINRRAYEIYLERDSFGGNELDDWLQAEAELRRNAIVTRTAKETDVRGR